MFSIRASTLVILFAGASVFAGALSSAEAQRRGRRGAIDRDMTAEEDDPAREHFYAGVTLYESGDREGALEEFRASFEVREQAVAAYNVAQILREQRNYEEALEWYGRFIATGAGSISRARRRQVNTLIRRLERLLVQVEVVVVPEGTAVRVDDRPVGTTPLVTPLRLAPGPHHLTLRADDHETQEVEIRVAGRRPLRFEYVLQPARPRSTLVLRADQPAAELLVDGVLVGEGEATTALESGGHTVEARHADFTTYRTTVSIGESQELELHLSLTRNPEPWETWWFWTIVGVVVVGAAAGVTAGVLVSQ